MLPEISRRCTGCGAAVRANATFCHQCGNPVNRPTVASDEGVAESVERSAANGGSAGLEPDAPGVLTAPPVAGETASVIGPAKDSPPKGFAVEERTPAESSTNATGGERARAKLQRARAVARGAMEEKVAPRVEKLRQTSSVVLDGASDDPSLRFVLIAAALFILFLVLFFISRMLG
jgi:hypothetical protein